MDTLHRLPSASSAIGAAPLAIEQFYPLLRRVARRCLSPNVRDVDPDDLVQDVLMRTWRRFSALRFADAHGMKAYLSRAVANRARDERRRKRRWVDLEAAELWSDGSPLDDVLRMEARRLVRVALAQFRSGDRQVVVGRYVEDLPFSDLAAQAGYPSADAARKAATRALHKLRHHVEQG